MRYLISSWTRVLLAVSLLASVQAFAQSTVLVIHSEAGDYIGQGASYSYQAPAHAFSVNRNHDRGIDVSVEGWYLGFAAAGGTALAAGPHEMAARLPFR